MSNTFTLSFTLWEVALLIIAIAFVFGTVHLIKALKSLAETFTTVNRLMEDNRSGVKNIVANASDMTDEAEGLVKETRKTVDSLQNEVVGPAVELMSYGVKLLTVLGHGKTRAKKKTQKKQ